MQNNILKLSILVFSLFAIVFTSCEKDQDTFTEQLQGTWIVTSFTIDTQEAIGVFFEEFTFTFGEYNETNGSIILTQTDNDGEVDAETGTYIVTGSNISIDVDGDIIEFTTDMVENRMTLTGTDEDGLVYVIKLEK